MKDGPLITIIIPTYNSALCIKNCLESIFCQTFLNFEVLVVDGVSQDDTVAILQEFESRYHNFKWICENDKGIYDAMNKGVTYSKGQWLYFLGSDDSLRNADVLANVANVLYSTDAHLIYGDVTFVSSNRREGEEISLKRLLTQGNICHQTMFYHRSIFELIGKYNLNYPIVADWDFNIRCFKSLEIKTQYFHCDIVLYNDVTGVSSISRNDPFYELVPASYIWELNILKIKNNELLNSFELKIGRFIYKMLKIFGIIYIKKLLIKS